MTHADRDSDRVAEEPNEEDSGPLPETTDDDGDPVENPSG